MNKLIISLFLLLMHQMLFAQECGPFCPVCSGTGSSTSGIVAPGTVIPSILFIPNGEEETAVFNLRSGITKWMDAGIGYTLEAEKIIWSLRIQPIEEEESSWRPGLILGTGSVQTGKSDQSIFVQLSKSYEMNEMIAFRFSTGAASLLPDLDEVYALAGLTLTIAERFSPFISYDGISIHPGISWIPTDWLTIGAILIESKEPAVSMGLRLNLSQGG